jgi:hypothetical protein
MLTLRFYYSSLVRAPVNYNNWEADKLQSCLCDAGWEGYDCSQRTCPKGRVLMLLYCLHGISRCCLGLGSSGTALLVVARTLLYCSTHMNHHRMHSRAPAIVLCRL